MQASSELVEFLKKEEGCVLTAYLCPGGHWTIGYGHTSMAGPPHVTPGMRINLQVAETILRRDLAKFEIGVMRLVKVPLTQFQFDALVSFAFNLGLTNLKKSTLLKVLNQGKYDAVPAQLMRWTRAGGRELRGLVKRRRAEAEIWRGLRWNDTPEIEESRTVPDMPETPPITSSREAAGAAAGGGLSFIWLWAEFKDFFMSGQFTKVLTSPGFIFPLTLILIFVAIIYWRRQRQLEGA